MRRFRWSISMPGNGMIEDDHGDWVLYTEIHKKIAALTDWKQIAEGKLSEGRTIIVSLKEELKLNASMLAKQCDLAREAETELESHAWKVSPAMAQAKIDLLNDKLHEVRQNYDTALDEWHHCVNEIAALREKIKEDEKEIKRLKMSLLLQYDTKEG